MLASRLCVYTNVWSCPLECFHRTQTGRDIRPRRTDSQDATPPKKRLLVELRARTSRVALSDWTEKQAKQFLWQQHSTGGAQSKCRVMGPEFPSCEFPSCRTASLPLGQGHRRTLEKHGGKNEKQKKGNTKREKTAELTMCDFSVWLVDGRQVEVGQWGDNWAGVRALFRFLVRAPTRVRVRVRAGA